MTLPQEDLRILRTRYLRGPNLWTYRPVLETWLDLGGFEDFPSHTVPGLNGRLEAWLPGLPEHHCGVGEVGGFRQRLEGGTWLGHVLEHICIELLNLAGTPTGFGQTRSTSQRGVYRMVFRVRAEVIGLQALQQGLALLLAAVRDRPFDVPAAVAALRTVVDDHYLGPSTAAIVDAATDRRIPHIRLTGGNLVQLGYGARQRRIWTAETELTSAIGESVASDKDLTKELLAACGVPVPEGRVVASAAQAWDAAEDIGLPVVVKPTDGNHGRGVTLELMTRPDVERAYAAAEPEGSGVLVERHIRGHEHRLLVVGGKVVAAARGEVVTVTGDGSHSVRELIELQVNTDPRRGAEEDLPLETMHLDRDLVAQLELERQGLDGDSVPAAGRVVVVQRNGNVAIDCTDEVCPEVDALAGLAARIVGLDIAGIDCVTGDIAQPFAAQGGAIVEVNAGPGLLMHLKPAIGTPRPVGEAIAAHLFPEPAEALPGRIPIVGIAGSRHGGSIARLLGRLLALRFAGVGVACSEGLYVGSRCLDAAASDRWDAAHRLMVNRGVEVAVVQNSAAAILDDGLAYDRCHVGVVTDLDGAESLAHHDVEDAADLARVLRTQVDVVLPAGCAVLHAADDRIAAMAPLSDGAVLLYAADGALPVLAAHRETGGRTVSLRGTELVLADGSAEATVPMSAQAAAPEAVLAAVAAAWALDCTPDLIAAGLAAPA